MYADREPSMIAPSFINFIYFQEYNLCIKVFWDMIPCCFVEGCKNFEGMSSLQRLLRSRQKDSSKFRYLFTKLVEYHTARDNLRVQVIPIAK
jgi:hypothetical protein